MQSKCRLYFLSSQALFSCTCSAEEIDCWVSLNQRQKLIPDYPASRWAWQLSPKPGTCAVPPAQAPSWHCPPAPAPRAAASLTCSAAGDFWDFILASSNSLRGPHLRFLCCVAPSCRTSAVSPAWLVGGRGDCRRQRLNPSLLSEHTSRASRCCALLIFVLLLLFLTGREEMAHLRCC